MYNCSLLVVGDELLDGRVDDTNSDFIMERLRPLGIRVVLCIAVGDDMGNIGGALALAMRISDAVIVTGGLGPTGDDLTREAVAQTLGLPLRRDTRVEENLRAFFASMGRKMSPTNLKQADMVEGASPIPARLGTAPGQWIEHRDKVIALVPGVPREMRDMIEGDVVPQLARRFSLEEKSEYITLLVAARPESEIAEQVQDALSSSQDVNVSYRSMMGQIEVRLSARRGGPVTDAGKRVREALGPWVVAEGEETLEGNLGREMRSRGITCAVAESLTGGMVGERITRVPGSSDYFLGGIVAYTHDAKERLLGVDRELLETRGAANEEVAESMARGVRKRLSTHVGFSVTGVAGPDSGGEKEPVGTVAFGIADADVARSWKYRLPGDREMVRQFATTVALTIAYFHLRGEDVADVR